MQALHFNKPGTWTGRVMARVVEWQLQNPDKGKEDCRAWLKAEQASGRITIDEGSSGAKRANGGGDGDKVGGKKTKR
jgi:tRNA nucleotidyltransferase (CCA-adding enzyme)